MPTMLMYTCSHTLGANPMLLHTLKVSGDTPHQLACKLCHSSNCIHNISPVSQYHQCCTSTFLPPFSFRPAHTPNTSKLTSRSVTSYAIFLACVKRELMHVVWTLMFTAYGALPIRACMCILEAFLQISSQFDTVIIGLSNKSAGSSEEQIML